MFFRFLDVYLIPDPSPEGSMQMTYCIWPHYSNKLKTKTTQTNIVNFSLLNCGELWGRGERDGSHSSHCLSWYCGPGSAAVVLLLLLFYPQDDEDERVIIFGFPCLGSRVSCGSDLICCSLYPLCSSYSISPSERARCLPCTETRPIATIVAALWRCNEEDYPGPLIIWLCHVPGPASCSRITRITAISE